MRPDGPISRRAFLAATGASALIPAADLAAPAETAAARLHRSLTPEQKGAIAFPADHPLRSVARNHWKIVEPTIADLSGPQRLLCREVFETLCSDEGRARLDRQMADDAGGFDRYHVALFGSPEAGPFEWVLTGRHVTIRADGRTGLASRGPIFLGHGVEVPEIETSANVWLGPARRVAAFLDALDEPDRRRASGPEGISRRALGDEAGRRLRALLAEAGGPFRSPPPEVAPCLKPDGVERLRLSLDPRSREGRVWALSGPGFVWYYHSVPHVHSWIEGTGPTAP